MANFFTVPNKEKDFQAYMIFVLAILWAVAISVTVSIGFIYFPHLWLRWSAFIVTAASIGIFTLMLNSRGHVYAAGVCMVVLVWLLITVPCYSAGGIMAPGILSQVSVILTAGFILGWRGGLVIGLLTIGTDFWFVYLEMNGSLPAPTVVHTPVTRWIGNIIPFGTIFALQYYATDHLRTGLKALQNEIVRREEAETIVQQTVHSLKERVKELKTINQVSHILNDEDAPLKRIFRDVVDILPGGWQYPEITAARICFSGTELSTANYRPSVYSQRAEAKTEVGSMLSIEVVYLQQMPDSDEGPFLKEERNLIDMLAEMVKMNIERRERKGELKDYKHALDVGYMVSISGADNRFSYVNENFCRASKYQPEELFGQDYNMIMSGYHSPEYFAELGIKLQEGKPYRGEFRNQAKDGTTYWVDTTIVPFLDDEGHVYQYLTINHDITERKEATDKIKKSAQLLKKITSQVPGNTYMFEIEESGHSSILFLSRGTDTINHTYDPKQLVEHPETFREVLHDDDKVKFNEAMKEAYKTEENISFQYRIVINGNIRWRWMQAVPEKDDSGKVIWYGATSDITPLIDYIASIQQVIFDIGHVIRRPVSSMLGLTQLIASDELNEAEVKEFSQKLNVVAEEIDKFIRELNKVYQQKSQGTQLNIDISSLLDPRSSLFK